MLPPVGSEMFIEASILPTELAPFRSGMSTVARYLAPNGAQAFFAGDHL